MITALALTLLSAGSVADDTTPISAAIVEVVINDPATGGPVCDAYSSVMGAIGGMGLDADGHAVFVEVVDAYAIVMLEGDSLRLDNAARAALTDWLHTSCS